MSFRTTMNCFEESVRLFGDPRTQPEKFMYRARAHNKAKDCGKEKVGQCNLDLIMEPPTKSEPMKSSSRKQRGPTKRCSRRSRAARSGSLGPSVLGAAERRR